MFELGPEWLDRYVRAFLTEVISTELENVIVKGTGKKQPMIFMLNLKDCEEMYLLMKQSTSIRTIRPKAV